MNRSEYSVETHGMWRIRNGTQIKTGVNWIALVVGQSGPDVRVVDPNGFYIIPRERIVKNGRRYEVQW